MRSIEKSRMLRFDAAYSYLPSSSSDGGFVVSLIFTWLLYRAAVIAFYSKHNKDC